MRKTITTLFLCTGILFMASPGRAQSSAQNHSATASTTVAEKNGIKIFVVTPSGADAANGTRINFLNLTHENVVFTWTALDKTGKPVYTSSLNELKPGATTLYPASGETIAPAIKNGIDANFIEINIKK